MPEWHYEVLQIFLFLKVIRIITSDVCIILLIVFSSSLVGYLFSSIFISLNDVVMFCWSKFFIYLNMKYICTVLLDQFYKRQTLLILQFVLYKVKTDTSPQYFVNFRVCVEFICLYTTKLILQIMSNTVFEKCIYMTAFRKTKCGMI